MAINVTRKMHKRANRRYHARRRQQMSLAHALEKSVGHYNIIGHTTGFKADTIYQVTWLVGGQPVGNALVVIPSEECNEDRSPDQWFNQYVQTIMFGFDIEQADIMVSEVIDDTKKMQ